MKTTKTIYQFIVDKSTSMQGSEEQVITGFNIQLAKLKELAIQYPAQNYIASVTYFDSEIQEEISFGAIEAVQPLTMESYTPDGMTALLDAVGGAIDTIQETYAKELSEEKLSVVFIILTDGEENYSTLYTYEFVAQKIEKLEKTGAWTFTFMGADFDPKLISERLNIRKENVHTFEKRSFVKTMSFLAESMGEFENAKSKGETKSSFFKRIFKD
jgi:uncharacterized protein YegL